MNESSMRRCIEQKRDGSELSPAHWREIVEGFMDGSVDEAQMAALCMACVLRGMSFDEAYALTAAMVESGEVLHFDPEHGIVVDKHSSGGVSDIVSLAAVPLAAACGAKVAKLSGRALGHTGGTIDKLEAIPGFNAALSMEQFAALVDRIGCAIAAQTESLVPADKRIYRLRDRTGSVPATGLIAASIVSKKIAGGAHAFVFDVKTGAASFMRETEQARQLAAWLAEIAARFGRRATAFVTDMNQPLAHCIGTGIEVLEACDLLAGKGDSRARELVEIIACALVSEAQIDEPERSVQAALEDGSGYRKFAEMIAAQGGDLAALERQRPQAAATLCASADGYVARIDVVELGNAGRSMSHGDPTGGLRVEVRLGEHVDEGAPLVRAYGKHASRLGTLERAFTIGKEPPPPLPLVYDALCNNVTSVRYPR